MKARVLGNMLHHRLHLVDKTEVMDAIGDAQEYLRHAGKAGWDDSP